VSYEYSRLAAILLITLGFGLCVPLIAGSAVWTIPLKMAILGIWAAVLAMAGLIDSDDKRILRSLPGKVGEKWRSVRKPIARDGSQSDDSSVSIVESGGRPRN
jgi:hypothetical protein